jgi:hypothetical protein
MDKDKISKALLRSWSQNSSSLYTEKCPARGQCGVTSLVIQDNFGGEILKTQINNETHFYNRIKGEAIDFTASQFEQMPNYEDVTTSRYEAMSDTNESQYKYLKDKFIINYKLG